MEGLRNSIACEIRSLFIDEQGRRVEISRADKGLFGPGSMVWRVHGDVTTMMIGGIASLLIQMLHPEALAGVWDHSNFREDRHGRLRRTANFIAETSYGDTAQAERAVARVNRIHAKVAGTLPGGVPYRADNPRTLAWVHAAETLCFLKAYVRYRDPLMGAARQDRYCAEMAEIGRRLGADPVPDRKVGLERLIESFRPELRADERTAEVVKFLLTAPPSRRSIKPFQQITIQAGVELMPGWARAMHGLDMPALARPAVRGGGRGLATVMRWAMR